MVWIAPPCGPFSPLQHANARSTEQKEELQRKRQQAQKAYVGASIVYAYCVQQGIHCAREMPERSDAWRLPRVQQFQKKFQPFVAVTHGCQVGLRSGPEQPLVKKGWRIFTTHARLAEVMQCACRCPKTYQHARCDGEMSTQSARYTRAYAERAAKALLLELDHVSVYQECQGRSKLPETFGDGLACQCDQIEGVSKSGCGFCLQNSQASGLKKDPSPQAAQEDPQDLEPQPEEAMYSKEEIYKVESRAQELMKRQDFSLEACEALIKGMSWQARISREGKFGSQRVQYHAFGAYSYGANHGVCNSTTQFPKFLKYINMFLSKRMKNPRKRTSLVLNPNNRMPIHRDVHNQANQPNVVLGLGKCQNGGLWSTPRMVRSSRGACTPPEGK